MKTETTPPKIVGMNPTLTVYVGNLEPQKEELEAIAKRYSPLGINYIGQTSMGQQVDIIFKPGTLTGLLQELGAEIFTNLEGIKRQHITEGLETTPK